MLLVRACACLCLALNAQGYSSPPCHCHSFLTETRAFISKPDPFTQYEYVIVGSGAGGATLAARLATYGHSVLLVEAGSDETESYNYRVPAFNLLSSENHRTSWNFYVHHYNDLERQKRDSKMVWRTQDGQIRVGSKGRKVGEPLGILYPRAGTFGGCTAHNALITVLPDDYDWQSIADVTKDDSWSPREMRRLWRRIEMNTYLTSLSEGHGFAGWLATAVADLGLIKADWKLVKLVLSTVKALNPSWIERLTHGLVDLASVLLRDINSDIYDDQERTGLFQIPLSLSNATRSGPVDFVLSVMQRKDTKLDIMLDTLVTKIRFADGGISPRAVGVDYMRGPSLYKADPHYVSASKAMIHGTIHVTKEVILSGGAFNTPQLLKLSGIGPRLELQHFNITVHVDLPGVGTNLQDRYELTVVANNTEEWSLLRNCTFLQRPDDPCLERWENEDQDIVDRGAYATGGLILAVVKKTSVAENGVPDVFMAVSPVQFKGYYPGYSVDAIRDKRQVTWLILKGYTHNKAGTVKLRSNDPRDTPIINFNYFDTGSSGYNKDVQALMEGLKFARNAVKELDGFNEVWPGPEVQSDDELIEFMKREAWGHHASCTCPIGGDDDPDAVLDSKFRVRGVANLRVVDASVFPRIPGYFIAAPIYMIAEKAADVIHFGK